ncbi:AGR083Wp [Eremothecium gossypii ATCC 10895]|uniref:AGR083Wp n=1 Tax=Eremothecium gossypii (strain ATCC 10895 / CBS 109.51 / FGSC 9923 / NRRL Y-1056) TaxID=284811 RepID=Q74ZX5_EREGS|nr:AGR083Wp [Eremothecium gossypii ATCC 10895]AAS54572.1 AGR083Wp [Eremothecium gossypii ATCC 10895]AEY98904.1 FAGR083Wp [Eremothecium gossypii FDAG1]
MKKHEDKENLVTSAGRGAMMPRTPIHQLKRSSSNLAGRNSTRMPLASKDRNQSQGVFGLKTSGAGGAGGAQAQSKRPASSSIAKNMPDSKLKKYGSVLGVGYGSLAKAKSLVLKDTSDCESANEESEEEEGNPLAAKLKSRLCSAEEGGNEDDGSSGLLLGEALSQLAAAGETQEDVPPVEYAPEKLPELPHVPNGYESLKSADLAKLAKYHSPFLRFGDKEDEENTEPGDSQQLIPLEFGALDDSQSSSDEDDATSNGAALGAIALSQEEPDEVQFEFAVGEGLDSKDLHSLLD